MGGLEVQFDLGEKLESEVDFSTLNRDQVVSQGHLGMPCLPGHVLGDPDGDGGDGGDDAARKKISNLRRRKGRIGLPPFFRNHPHMTSAVGGGGVPQKQTRVQISKLREFERDIRGWGGGVVGTKATKNRGRYM